MQSVTLTELTNHLQELIRDSFNVPVWIRAEISEMRENQNGHCYLEFTDKADDTDNVQSRCKGVIWASTNRMLQPYFESATGERLRAGMKVLVAVTVEFSGLYGFSLVVRDIDPAFTLGEMAARRLKIIRQLQTDGVADMNKELKLPLLPQRIAVVSSPTAAGLDDFQHQLQQNKYGFAFHTHLFPAVMQGDQAPQSVVGALDKIYEHVHLFDAVVIIRGGGAVADLACFDNYDLALNCAQFPLPVLTGLGHQRDSTILDMVAFESLKTPTAVAEFLVARMFEAAHKTQQTFVEIVHFFRTVMTEEDQKINEKKWLIRQTLRSGLNKNETALRLSVGRLKNYWYQVLNAKNTSLSLATVNLKAHSPEQMLKYGYALLEVNGKRVYSVEQVKEGDLVRAFLSDGDFNSTVVSK